MRKGIFVKFGILAIVALTTFLVVDSALAKQKTCKESLKECCRKKKTVPYDNIILETLSRQLISIQ